MKRLLFVVALLVSAFRSSGGQSLGQLPRATVATGMNDSTLIYVSDSAKRSRAAVAPDFRKMLSLRAFDSLMTTNLRLTGGAITGSPTATFGAITVSSCTGCAPTVVDSATGAARAQILTTARTIGGTSFNGSANIVPGLSDSATGATRAQKLTTARTIGGTSFDGTANITPALSDSSTGSTRAQKLTTARALWGQSFDGTAAITGSLTGVGSVTGGASAMTILSGTGNNRNLILQSSNSSGSATTFLTGAGDTTKLASRLYLTGNSTIVAAGGAGTLSNWSTFGSSASSGNLFDFNTSGGGNSFSIHSAGALGVNGTAAAPAFAFISDTATGVRLASASTLGFSAGGSGVGTVNSSAAWSTTGSWTVGNGTATIPSYGFTSATGNGFGMRSAGTSTDSIGVFIANKQRFSFVSNGGGFSSLVFGQDTATVGQLAARNGAGTISAVFRTWLADSIGLLSNSGSLSMTVKGGVAPTWQGGAGNLTIVSGTGNSRSLSLQSTSGAGTPGTFLSGNANYHAVVGTALALPNGSSSTNSLYWTGAMGAGLYMATNGSSADTVVVQTQTARALHITGGGATTVMGGPGNLTLISGTGASRTMLFQTTTSGSTPTTALTLNADQTSTFAQRISSTNGIRVGDGSDATPSFSFTNGTNYGFKFVSASSYIGLVINGNERAIFNDASAQFLATDRILVPDGTSASVPGIAFSQDANTGIRRKGADTVTLVTGGTDRLHVANQGATGAGDVSLCVTTTGVTKVITQGAACGTSSAKAKVGFGSIFNPVEKTMALRPTGYSYIPGMYDGRREYGLVADSTMAVDSLLVFRAQTDQFLPNGQTIRKGDALNVNDRAVLALLTATVQELVKKGDRQQATIDSLRVELSRTRRP